MKNDPVDEVIQAYLDYLENGAPEPSLDHLTSDERSLAQDIINSLIAGHGIDPYDSRPSFNALVAGTEFEDLLKPAVTEGLTVDAIRTDVVSSLGTSSEPIADGAALNEGIRSNAVIRFGSLRIRVQFRDDLTTPAALAKVDPRTAAGPAFGRFPDTAAVVLVIGDEELSSVAIGPFDVDDFIGTPDGQVHRPRITRPVLPLSDTLLRLVDEFSPDLGSDDPVGNPEPVDVAHIIQVEATAACSGVVAEGRKARTEAKKDAWANFEEAALISGIVQDIASGELGEAELDARITAAAAA